MLKLEDVVVSNNEVDRDVEDSRHLGMLAGTLKLGMLAGTLKL